MYRVAIRFYEELNDFLPPDRRKKEFDFEFADRRSIKDLIESLGVPHVEVDLILINGESVDFGRIVANGDRISVYPVFESIDITHAVRLRPAPLRDPRFVLDVHLGKLARRLRLMGFDTDYEKDRGDVELADVSERGGKILLTRDRQLVMRKNVSRGLYVRATDPARQIVEVLQRLDLRDSCRPFTRCIECNGMIRHFDAADPASAEAAAGIPPGVRSWCRQYYQCEGCGRIFWKGSHYEKLKKRVESILTHETKSS